MSKKKEPAEANPGRRSLATTAEGGAACKSGKGHKKRATATSEME
jgi:hypothetical protein